MLTTMQGVLAQADANLDASDAGSSQHYRFLCQNGVDVTIRNVTLVPVGTDAAFTYDDYVYSLQSQVALGLGPVDFSDPSRIYTAFVDQITGVYPYGGQGSVWNDDRPDPALNRNNTADAAKYSMSAYFDAHLVGHELGHNIGAVQLSAPHSSGAFHCHDENDLMCYSDGGSYFTGGGQLTFPCTAAQAEVTMDCGQDDYYSAVTPAPNSYLATHWNTAGSSFLTPLSRTATSRYEESAAAFDGWTPLTDGTGTYRASKTTGDTAQLTFSGTNVKWLTKKGPAQGKAEVLIDGVNKGTFDTYATTFQSSTVSFAGLSSGSHKIVIKALGTKSVSASAAKVAVDGFTAGATTTQETSVKVLYGRWKGVRSSSASGGAFRSSATPGSTATFTFAGPGVDWVTATGPAWGRAEIFIDGASKGVVDLYAPTARYQITKSYTSLTSGSHTITVKVLGTKNAAATAKTVSVDGFIVR